MSTFTDETEQQIPADPAEETTTTTQEDDNANPLNNVIPMDKIKNGWMNIKAFVLKNTAVVVDKVVEINNSEEVKNFKTKTTEVSQMAWETTKTNVALAADAAQPTLEKLATVTQEATEKVVSYSAEAGTMAYHASNDIYQTHVRPVSSKYFGDFGEDAADGSGGSGTPSALDQATKGGPMTL